MSKIHKSNNSKNKTTTSTGDLREHYPTVPTAPPMRLPIPNSNPKP